MPKPRPTHKQIGLVLGLTEARVGQLVKQGMPNSSIPAAKKWREKNPVMRAPTNARQAGVKEKDQATKKGAKMQRTEDPIMDLVAATRIVQGEAFEILTDAMANKRISSIPTLIQAHNKAVEASVSAERSYREELERRGLLVPKIEITERCKNALSTVLKLLKKLPTETGPQCNETEPLKATTILQRKVNDIIGAGQKSLQTL